MSFYNRAQKAYDRGDIVRAVVMLIEGLKRSPDHAEALDMLLRLYGIEVDGMGLEPDVIKILELQPDANDLLSVLVDNARGCGHDRVADALLELGGARGLAYVPESEDDEPDEPEGQDEPDEVGQSPGESPADPQEEPAVDEPADVAPETEDSPIPEELLSDIDDLGERSVPEDDELPAESEDAPETKKRGQDEPKKPRRKRRTSTPPEDRLRLRKRYFFIITVVALIAISLFVGYREVQRVSAEASVESALASSAPHRIGEVEDKLGAVGRSWATEEGVHDRIAFVRAYASWTTGKESDITPLGDSPWATGALAIAAAQRGDLEEALEMTTRAERADAAAVPSLMARAIIEETRNRWSASDRAWANVVERDPDVLAGYEGRARNAWRRLDERQLQNALGALERRDESHPYLVLSKLESPLGVVDAGLTVDTSSRFLQSLELFRRVRIAYARGDDEAGIDAANELSLSESDGVAALQHGVALAHGYQAEEASKAFQRAALTEGMTREFRLRLQSQAVESLAGIGRPDLSEPFETVLTGKTPREKIELRIPALRKPAIDSVRESPWAVRAVFAHIGAVAQRGDYEQAIELYEFVEGREVDPERARWEAALLRLEIGSNTRASGLSAEGEAVWSAASSYLDGQFETVNATTTLPTEGALGERARRYQILSLIASRRVAVALQLMEEERGNVSAASDGLRIRAYARQARENLRFERLYQRMKAAKPVGVQRRADLAAAAFWQGKVDEAEEFSAGVIESQEGHREANWIMGLILRQRGKFDEANKYLRRSGRDWDDTAGLLVELGHVSLALENWDEARKNFYKAFLKNRENIEAIRGLGAAYAAVRSEIAVRDLARIEAGLPNTQRFAPVRGEVLRWLAVVNGVREGNEPALSYLKASMKQVGRRPDLLVEEARYHEAREERKEARKLYAAALQGNTTLASAHLGLARTALLDGDESVARDHLERYLEVEPRGGGADWARKRLASLNEEP